MGAGQGAFGPGACVALCSTHRRVGASVGSSGLLTVRLHVDPFSTSNSSILHSFDGLADCIAGGFGEKLPASRHVVKTTLDIGALVVVLALVIAHPRC